MRTTTLQACGMRTSTLQTCPVVPRRARIQGSKCQNQLFAQVSPQEDLVSAASQWKIVEKIPARQARYAEQI